jgi:multidrug efflux pump subunit AcrB
MKGKKRWIKAAVLLGALLGLCALGAVGLFGLAWKLGKFHPRPVVEVVTCHPGMPASSIEKTITNRVERWVNQAPGAEKVTSRSLDGVSIVRITFRNDVDAGDALVQVNALVLEGVLPVLPASTLPPVVLPRDPDSSQAAGMLVIHGPELDEATLAGLARGEIRAQVGSLGGAAAPVVLGGRGRAVIVHLDPRKLGARKLTPMSVIEALRKSALKDALAGGSFRDNQLSFDADDRILDLGILNDLPVAVEGPEPVRLRDIGSAEVGLAAQTTRLRIDGRGGVGVPVYPQKDVSPRAVSDKVAPLLGTLEKRMPPGVRLRWLPLGPARRRFWSADDGLLTIYLRAPSHLGLETTEKHAAAVEQVVEKAIPANEREAVISEVGLAPNLAAAFTANAGPHDATLVVPLSADRKVSAAAYAAKLRPLLRDDPRFAELRFRFAARDMPAPVDVRIEAGEAEARIRLALEVQARLAAIKGAADVEVAQRRDAPVLTVRVDTRKARAAGRNPGDVLLQVLAGLKARIPLPSLDSDFRNGEASLRATPCPEGPRRNLEDVLDAEVAGGDAGQPVKLASLVRLERSTAAVEIDHADLVPVFDVRANIEDRSRGDVVADVRKMIAELTVPEGVRVRLVE